MPLRLNIDQVGCANAKNKIFIYLVILVFFFYQILVTIIHIS